MASAAAVSTAAERKMVQELAESGGDPPPSYIVKDADRPIGDPLQSSDLPTVDFSRLFGSGGWDNLEAQKLMVALQSWGIFQVVGHSIPTSLLDEVRDQGKKFFQLPLEGKQKYSNLMGGRFSYEGYGNDQIIKDNQVLDWTDRLYLLVQPEDQRNWAFWPEDPVFRETVNEFTIKTRQVADQFLKVVGKLLDLDEHYFIDLFGDKATVYARFNYYPTCSRPDLVFGIKPHNDASTFTIIIPDKKVEGLQVEKDGQWVKVITNPDALIINIGDQMEIMSNGIFKSPFHRVVTNSETERLSIAMFYAVEPEKEIEPASGLINEQTPSLYRKVKVKEYLDVFFQNFLQGRRTIDWAKV